MGYRREGGEAFFSSFPPKCLLLLLFTASIAVSTSVQKVFVYIETLLKNISARSTLLFCSIETTLVRAVFKKYIIKLFKKFFFFFFSSMLPQLCCNGGREGKPGLRFRLFFICVEAGRSRKCLVLFFLLLLLLLM